MPDDDNGDDDYIVKSMRLRSSYVFPVYRGDAIPSIPMISALIYLENFMDSDSASIGGGSSEESDMKMALQSTSEWIAHIHNVYDIDDIELYHSLTKLTREKIENSDIPFFEIINILKNDNLKFLFGTDIESAYEIACKHQNEFEQLLINTDPEDTHIEKPVLSRKKLEIPRFKTCSLCNSPLVYRDDIDSFYCKLCQYTGTGRMSHTYEVVTEDVVAGQSFAVATELLTNDYYNFKMFNHIEDEPEWLRDIEFFLDQVSNTIDVFEKDIFTDTPDSHIIYILMILAKHVIMRLKLIKLTKLMDNGIDHMTLLGLQHFVEDDLEINLKDHEKSVFHIQTHNREFELRIPTIEPDAILSVIQAVNDPESTDTPEHESADFEKPWNSVLDVRQWCVEQYVDMVKKIASGIKDVFDLDEASITANQITHIPVKHTIIEDNIRMLRRPNFITPEQLREINRQILSTETNIDEAVNELFASIAQAKDPRPGYSLVYGPQGTDGEILKIFNPNYFDTDNFMEPIESFTMRAVTNAGYNITKNIDTFLNAIYENNSFIIEFQALIKRELERTARDGYPSERFVYYDKENGIYDVTNDETKTPSTILSRFRLIMYAGFANFISDCDYDLWRKIVADKLLHSGFKCMNNFIEIMRKTLLFKPGLELNTVETKYLTMFFGWPNPYCFVYEDIIYSPITNFGIINDQNQFVSFYNDPNTGEPWKVTPTENPIMISWFEYIPILAHMDEDYILVRFVNDGIEEIDKDEIGYDKEFLNDIEGHVPTSLIKNEMVEEIMSGIKNKILNSIPEKRS